MAEPLLVDAMIEAVHAELSHVLNPWVGQLRIVWHRAADSPPLPAPDEHVLEEWDARLRRASVAAVQAVLHEQLAAVEREEELTHD